MDKTFTPNDLQFYLDEVSRANYENHAGGLSRRGPSNATLQNIYRYSSALNVIKTKSVGLVFQLGN
jgi:hypothetical protein